MNGAFRVHEFGPPEAMEWTELPPGSPGPGEALVRHTAIGVNFIDVYHRTGVYELELPFTPGVEGAGVVVEVGEGVDRLGPGDRVGYAGNAPVGSYREARILPAAILVRLPDSIDDVTAAGIMLKGGTVEYLIRRVARIEPGSRVLLHAAAGGIGTIASQWLADIGARVIGTAGTREKAEMARRNGCEETILYREEDVADRVREITDGRGVDVVLDGVGRATFTASLDSLAPRGLLVTFGNASGVVEPFAPIELAKRGSLTVTRPRMGDYYSDPAEAAAGFAALFEAVESGAIESPVKRVLPLRDAPSAHRALEARETTGSTVLDPGSG